MVISSLRGEGLGSSAVFQRNYCVQQKPSGKRPLLRFLGFLLDHLDHHSPNTNSSAVWDVGAFHSMAWDSSSALILGYCLDSTRLDSRSLIDGCCWRLFFFLCVLEEQKQKEKQKPEQQGPAIIRYFQHQNYYNILLLTAAVFLPARLF